MQHADIAVVVLAHNGRPYSEQCLASLLRSNPLPQELFLVDNGSTDGTGELFAQIAVQATALGMCVYTWSNDENKGCSAARNDAWRMATTGYVMFLDNDTVVRRRDWLAQLQAVLDADSGVALVGPKLVYPHKPHPIQCAGVMVNPHGRVRFRGRGQPIDATEFAQPADVHALISACWLMRNSLRDTVGVLDELFHPVQYEDLDLCFRAREAGYQCRYSPCTEVYHFEGKSTAASGKHLYQRVIAENSTKFRCKWRDQIRQLPPDPSDYRWLEDEELGLSHDIDTTIVS